TAPSACEAPVIMLRKNSAWPGASISTTSRERVRKRICVVSMVMPWSRSVCSASSRNDHSNGMPRRALTALSISSFPSRRLPLECIFGFVIERAPRAFRHLGAVEFGQDLVDVGGGGRHRIGDVLVAERAVTLAVLRQIKRDDRYVLALGVGPDVGLGPMQDRVN